jgi:predicted HD superfamily hydrolase involved in NAD metabolism
MIELQKNILAYLRKHVTHARLQHIMGTRTVSMELATRFGISPEKAEIAALLHDAAKDLSDRELTHYVRKYRIPIPDGEMIIQHHPSLLHSFVSAHIAQKVFKVTDSDILEAIARHTVGDINMSLLAKIIYLSEWIKMED